MGMSRVNVQYSNRIFLDRVFRCKSCGTPTIMLGCPNEGCTNYYRKEVADK